MNQALILARYAIDYFHAQIITFLCFTMMCLYYLYCLFVRYYVDADICMQGIIYDKLENGLFNTENNMPSSSLAQLGSINLCIKNKQYEKAIQLIENFKFNIKNRNNKLFTILTIRQAMLHMFLAKTCNEYEKIIEAKYINLSKNIKSNLRNIYLAYIS